MFTIHLAQPADITAIQQIATASWHATYQNIIPQKIQDNFLRLAYSDKMLQMRIANSHFYMIKNGETSVGFANFSTPSINNEVDLEALYLIPAAQHQGAGTLLWQFVLEQLQPKWVYVDVESENTNALNFYRKLGFHVLKIFADDFDGHPTQTTRMIFAQ